MTFGNCQVSMENLKCLFQLTPLLRHLKMFSYKSNRDWTFDGSCWENIFENSLPLLDRFQFFFTFKMDETLVADNFDSLILPFQSTFWLETKKWLVNCSYIPKVSKIQLYTIPVFMDVDTKSSQFEISSTNSECHFFPDLKYTVRRKIVSISYKTRFLRFFFSLSSLSCNWQYKDALSIGEWLSSTFLEQRKEIKEHIRDHKRAGDKCFTST